MSEKKHQWKAVGVLSLCLSGVVAIYALAIIFPLVANWILPVAVFKLLCGGC